MRTFKNFSISLLITFLLLPCYLVAETAVSGDSVSGDSVPTQEMRSTLDQLVQINSSFSGEENVELRLQKMRAVIEPRFDFEEMAKRSLGAKWKSISESERDEFVSLFSELLARTYLGRLESLKEDMVDFKDELIKLPRAIVKTEVSFDGDEFPIDYKLINGDKGWRVYDVVIENIGLISNYRNEFSGIIRKEKFAGLLAKLREKNSAPIEESMKQAS